MKRVLSVLILTIFSSISLFSQGAMSGIYSIGRERADFLTIAEAFNALETNGLSGQTILELTSTYNSEDELGQIVLNEIIGASEDNNIILTVDEETDFVEVAVNASSVFLFNDAKFFSLQGNNKLSIKNLNEEVSDVIIIVNYDPNNASYISIGGCELIGNNKKFNTTGIKLFSDLVNESPYNITIYDNNIYNVGQGIMINNSGETHNSEGLIRILGNKIGDNREEYRVSQCGIFAYSSANLEITNNTILNIKGDNNVWGILIEEPVNLELSANLVLDIVSTKDSCSALGIYIESQLDVEGNILCANNMISHVAAYDANGIYIKNDNLNKNIELYYNSVLLTVDYSNDFFGVRPSSCLLVDNNLGELNVINNIFENRFGESYKVIVSRYGSAIAYETEESPFTEISHNIFYTDHLIDGYSVRAKEIYMTFDEWQFLNNNDTTNLNIDPLFVSSSILKVKKANAAALPLEMVVNDYFGGLRSITTPDIGAHEAGSEDGINDNSRLVFEAYYSNGKVYVEAMRKMSGELMLLNMSGHIIEKGYIKGKSYVMDVNDSISNGLYLMLYQGSKQKTYTKFLIYK